MPVPTPARVEPSADMRSAAHTVREWFVALREQGFTEAQALTICGTMMGQAVAGNQSDDE